MAALKPVGVFVYLDFMASPEAHTKTKPRLIHRLCRTQKKAKEALIPITPRGLGKKKMKDHFNTNTSMGIMGNNKKKPA